jgi:hypothetical protein
VSQYALAIVAADPVDNGDYFALPISSLALGANPLVAGATGLSAAGISGNTAALQAQVEANTVAIVDLQARVVALEGQQQPPVTPTAPTVTGVTPNSGPAAGGTAVTISGTGFNTFGAYDVAFYDASDNYFDTTDFVVVHDNTITVSTAAVDTPGTYSLVVTFNAADNISLVNCFTYT